MVDTTVPASGILPHEVISDAALSLRKSLQTSRRQGIVLDIDETLSATNVKWFERLIHEFGNPESDLSVDDLIAKYHLAQYNPAWQSPQAQAWMQAQRTAPQAQENLPLIPGAVQGVQALQDITSVVAYLTVRPESVVDNTRRWLSLSGFPDLPIVSKPNYVPFDLGNQWKAYTLDQLWPEVTGIVDDNPKLPLFVGPEYQGTIYLFGHDSSTYEWAVPCKTWVHVVETVKQKGTTAINGENAFSRSSS